MGNKTRASKSDVAEIQKLYDEGVMPDQIIEQLGEKLNLHKNAITRAINAYKSVKIKEEAEKAKENLDKANAFHKIEADELEEIAEKPAPPVDKDGWTKAGDDAIDEIMSFNVSEERAIELVQKAMDEVDLTKEPDVESITSFVFKNSADLLNRSKNHEQTVVSMTAAASAATSTTSKQSTGKYDDCVFRQPGK